MKKGIKHMHTNIKAEAIKPALFSFILAIIFLAGISAVAAGTYNSDSADLKVIAEEISPEPVEPGQDVTVKIRLTNTGGDDAENVSLKLNSGFPFFVKTESNSFENKRSLCVGCSIENTYYLVVDANAKSGLYALDFDIYEGDLVVKPSETINIKVVGKPDIVLEANAPKANVSSGDSFELSFNAKNIGTGIARNIKVIPESSNILMLGSNVNLVDEIGPGKSAMFSQKFIIKESLEPDTYKFPVKIKYLDEQGNSYESEFEIGINVLERAEIDIQSLKITPKFPTIVDDAHIEGIIENTGTGDAENVIVKLIAPNNKSFKAFIGQLEAGDDAPFYFDAKPETAGVQTAILQISYNDDFGKHMLETTISKEISRPTNSLFKALAAIAIISIGIFYYFFKKKKAKS